MAPCSRASTAAKSRSSAAKAAAPSTSASTGKAPQKGKELRRPYTLRARKGPALKPDSETEEEEEEDSAPEDDTNAESEAAAAPSSEAPAASSTPNSPASSLSSLSSDGYGEMKGRYKGKGRGKSAVDKGRKQASPQRHAEPTTRGRKASLSSATSTATAHVRPTASFSNVPLKRPAGAVKPSLVRLPVPSTPVLSITTAPRVPPRPFPTRFVPPPTPNLFFIQSRVNEVLNSARLEATRDESLQLLSNTAVERALSTLPTRAQQLALSLVLNRYSSFCVSPAAHLPIFPITPFKATLFLSRTLDTPLGASMRSLFPQPMGNPLPVANGIDRDLAPMGQGEGERVSAELVKCWVEALGYAQGVTRGIWEPLLSGGGDAAGLMGDVGVGEVMAAVESVGGMMSLGAVPDPVVEERASERMGGGVRDGGPAKKRAKWTKGGKSVEGPPPKGTSPPSATSASMAIHTLSALPARPTLAHELSSTRSATPAETSDPLAPSSSSEKHRRRASLPGRFDAPAEEAAPRPAKRANSLPLSLRGLEGVEMRRGKDGDTVPMTRSGEAPLGGSSSTQADWKGEGAPSVESTPVVVVVSEVGGGEGGKKKSTTDDPVQPHATDWNGAPPPRPETTDSNPPPLTNAELEAALLAVNGTHPPLPPPTSSEGSMPPPPLPAARQRATSSSSSSASGHLKVPTTSTSSSSSSTFKSRPRTSAVRPFKSVEAARASLAAALNAGAAPSAEQGPRWRAPPAGPSAWSSPGTAFGYGAGAGGGGGGGAQGQWSMGYPPLASAPLGGGGNGWWNPNLTASGGGGAGPTASYRAPYIPQQAQGPGRPFPPPPPPPPFHPSPLHSHAHSGPSFPPHPHSHSASPYRAPTPTPASLGYPGPLPSPTGSAVAYWPGMGMPGAS